jgi:hypothetical protein
LDAGNPGSSYLWNNGAKSRRITVTTTGIGFDVQKYSVRVTNENQCENTDSILLVFTSDACVGIHELTLDQDFRIFPNPAGNFCTVLMKHGWSMMKISISDITGRFVSHLDFSTNPRQSSTFDIHELAPGLYFIMVTSNDRTGVGRLIIRRE